MFRFGSKRWTWVKTRSLVSPLWVVIEVRVGKTLGGRHDPWRKDVLFRLALATCALPAFARI
jgi:hypothetical protein